MCGEEKLCEEKKKKLKKERERGMELGGMNSGGKLKEKRKGGKEGEKKKTFLHNINQI